MIVNTRKESETSMANGQITVHRSRDGKSYNYYKEDKNGKITKVRHPAYIFLEKGNIWLYVTVTHSKSVDELIVVELRKNPDPNDKRKSYWVAEVKEDTKDSFVKRKTDWSID